MNEHFVNVKVDREERPDVDSIYMEAVVALTGSGGWPLTVFLTPDGEPFFGGTYFPPAPRHGHAQRSATCSRTVADGLARQARGASASRGEQLIEHLRTVGRRQAGRGRRRAHRGAALRRAREPDGGVRLGVGRLGRRAEVPAGADARVPAAPRRAVDLAETTLDAMAAGRHVRPRRRRLPPLLGRPAAGSCRTSRRCSTTTRSSPSATCTAGR